MAVEGEASADAVVAAEVPVLGEKKPAGISAAAEREKALKEASGIPAAGS